MANGNPYQARMGKQLRGKPGDIAEVQLVLWYALKRAQGVLDAATDEDATLRACHCVSQIAGSSPHY